MVVSQFNGPQRIPDTNMLTEIILFISDTSNRIADFIFNVRNIS
jgi:hypothetical protein